MQPDYTKLESAHAARRAAEAHFEELNPQPAAPALEIPARVQLIDLSKGHMWIEASAEWRDIKIKVFLHAGDSVIMQEITPSELEALTAELSKAKENFDILQRNTAAGKAHNEEIQAWESKRSVAGWSAEAVWEKANLQSDNEEFEDDGDDD